MRTAGKISRRSSAPKARKGRLLFKLLAVALLLSGVYFGVRYTVGFTRKLFPINEMVFYGNKHVTEAELKTMMGLRENEGLLWLSNKELAAKLLKSPWIRTVSFRKDFPNRYLVKIEEAEPFALLEMKSRTFFVDDRGNLLEEIKSDSIPFLPVISGDPFKNKNSFLEAISLVKVIKEKGFLNNKNRIEVMVPQNSGPEDIAMQVDGTLVKVGYGEYEEKLERLLELEDEIIRRGIPVDYIDLRFANRVVVKPINEVIK